MTKTLWLPAEDPRQVHAETHFMEIYSITQNPAFLERRPLICIWK